MMKLEKMNPIDKIAGAMLLWWLLCFAPLFGAAVPSPTPSPTPTPTVSPTPPPTVESLTKQLADETAKTVDLQKQVDNLKAVAQGYKQQRDQLGTQLLDLQLQYGLAAQAQAKAPAPTPEPTPTPAK
jgi:hypothetical protein